MTSDRSFQNKLTSVIGDLELIISRYKGHVKGKEREDYFNFIKELCEYAKLRIERLSKFGLTAPPDLKSFDFSMERKTEKMNSTGEKKKPPTSTNQNFQRENQMLKNENEVLRKQTEEQERQLQMLLHQNKQKFSREKQTAEQELLKLYNENISIREKIILLQKDNDYLRSELTVKTDLVAENSRLRDKVYDTNVRAEKLQKDKDDAFNRLSMVAGNRLREGNPSISDLSDDHRPTSVSMQLSELYSNEWTNAFEALLENGTQERQIIDLLLRIIVVSFTFNRGEVDARIGSQQNHSQEIAKLRSQSNTILEDIKKKCVTNIKRTVKELPTDPLHDDILKYMEECADVCWWICAQDPPLHLVWDFKQGSPVDTDILTFYTKSGKYVDYVVWPVLFLHRHGPILGKGVLQGMN